MAGWLRGGIGALATALRVARSDGISATILERDLPGDGSGQSGQFAEHDLDDVAKGIADIARLYRLALPSEPAVEEQLQKIEGQHPDQEQCVQGGWSVPIDMLEVPVTSPLVEGGVPFYLFIDPIESIR